MSKWDSEEDSDKLDEEEDESDLRCRYCGKPFLDYHELMLHVKLHATQNAINFIKENQPVGGRIITSRFKSFDLYAAEKEGKIKFSDEDMAWTLPDYSDGKIVIRSKPTKVNSISNAPCIDCIYEKNCSVDNENKIANPQHCELIFNWVNGQSKNKQKRIKKIREESFENIDVALFWFARSKKFNFIGTLEKNKVRNSSYEFNIVDEVFKSIPIIFDYYDKRKFKPGAKVKIIDARFSGSGHKLTLIANTYAKIQKL